MRYGNLIDAPPPEARHAVPLQLPSRHRAGVSRDVIMKKLAYLSLPGLVLLIFAGLAAAQPEGQDTTRPWQYDLKTEETLTGIVVAAPPAKTNLPQPVHLTLKAEKESIPVILGPGWFVEKAGVAIAALDKIEVKGSRIIFQGKPAIIAAEVKKGDKVLKLRNEKGVPLWTGPHDQKQ